MSFRLFACVGLVIFPAVLCCSSSDGPGAGSGGTGAGAGDAPGGSSAQAGSGGGGAGKAGNPSGGSGTGGSKPTQGGETGVAGGGGSGGKGGSAGAGGTISDGGMVGEGGSAGSGGAGDGDQVIEQCLDASVVANTRTEALEFSGAGLRLAIVRRVDPDAFGTSGTTVWLPQRFGLVRAGVAECISDLAALDYTVSHHNFDDLMTANHAAETWTFSQTRQDYDFPTLFSVEARAGNAVVWGPTTLTLVDCQELLQGESCLARYQ